ncbi:MAG: ATP synthase epsilon chain [Candidatus Binatia bacterium]|nr:MAG: ATP synthase epsilon chain [Candidatus Binatia bacterium]
MAGTFELRVVTPRGVVLERRVREVTAPSAVGQIGVLPLHTTYLGVLEVGCLEFVEEAGRGRVAIRGGFAEVRDDTMTVLTEAAERPEDVDLDAAEAEFREATRQLESLSLLDQTYPEMERTRLWARARLLAAGKAV